MRRLLRIVGRIALALAALWLVAALSMVPLKWIMPFTTALQTQRRIESWFSNAPYSKRCTHVPLSAIDPDLQHAVISAEDARFYKHHGFDWDAIEKAAHEDMEDGGRLRGGSTLTQQLVKNLYFGTHGSIVRKVAEAGLVPVAEFVLGKKRILELYLNVVEWGPGGIYGAEAAAEANYRTSAARLSRTEATRLAAVLPAPRKRKPSRMNSYSGIIARRMSQMGW